MAYPFAYWGSVIDDDGRSVRRGGFCFPEHAVGEPPSGYDGAEGWPSRKASNEARL